MRATHHPSATQDTGADSGANHQHDHVGLALARPEPTLSQQSGVAIAFGLHRTFKRTLQNVSERHLLPLLQGSAPSPSRFAEPAQELRRRLLRTNGSVAGLLRTLSPFEQSDGPEPRGNSY